MRDQVVDYVKAWTSKKEVTQKQLLEWIGIGKPKFYAWKERYGKSNEHNALIPRDHWLVDEEKAAIIAFHESHPLNGYRRLCHMMNDADVVAVSPSTVRNVLKGAGLMDKKPAEPSKKGTGFNQPLKPHQHWHTDVTYINLGGTFYYLSAVLDGYSRSIINWERLEKV